MSSPDVVWHHGHVTPEQRAATFGHEGVCVWFTGLSGSGKSTLAVALEASLVADGVAAYVLDGDNVRHGLCGDLGFSPEDRTENIRRIGEVAGLFVDAGLVVLTAFVSPYRADRARVRALVPAGRFVEVFVDCPIEACEARDVKGLYARARAGEVAEFTGISAPYEAPESADVVVRTDQVTVTDGVAAVRAALAARGVVPA